MSKEGVGTGEKVWLWLTYLVAGFSTLSIGVGWMAPELHGEERFVLCLWLGLMTLVQACQILRSIPKRHWVSMENPELGLPWETRSYDTDEEAAREANALAQECYDRLRTSLDWLKRHAPSRDDEEAVALLRRVNEGHKPDTREQEILSKFLNNERKEHTHATSEAKQANGSELAPMAEVADDPQDAEEEDPEEPAESLAQQTFDLYREFSELRDKRLRSEATPEDLARETEIFHEMIDLQQREADEIDEYWDELREERDHREELAERGRLPNLEDEYDELEAEIVEEREKKPTQLFLIDGGVDEADAEDHSASTWAPNHKS